MSVKKGSSRVWVKECVTGRDGSVCVGGTERGTDKPSGKRKPAMTPSEASVRLSSRAYSHSHYSGGAYDSGSRLVCSKLHTFQNNVEVDRGAPPYKVKGGWDGLAANPGGANSKLRIIVEKGGDSETLLTAMGMSGQPSSSKSTKPVPQATYERVGWAICAVRLTSSKPSPPSLR